MRDSYLVALYVDCSNRANAAHPVWHLLRQRHREPHSPFPMPRAPFPRNVYICIWHECSGRTINRNQIESLAALRRQSSTLNLWPLLHFGQQIELLINFRTAFVAAFWGEEGGQKRFDCWLSSCSFCRNQFKLPARPYGEGVALMQF